MLFHLQTTASNYDEIYSTFRWRLPARYNIAWDCCGRHAADPGRVALYYEDEAGQTSRHTFRDIQQAANRLSNALRALGVERGDRVGIILPQRPETAIAHMAIYQMGAIAVPLSALFGPEALQHRLHDSAACAVFVDEASLPNLWPIRDRLPALRQIIAVGGASESGTLAWSALLEKSAEKFPKKSPDQFVSADTVPDDPALLIYTSGTTGDAKGALHAHRVLPGHLPGYVCSHDFIPQPGDVFWSPADWAWAGGLLDGLLPTWHFGLPVLAYRGRFDAEKAFYLLEKYAIRNTFLFPTALKLMMKAAPEPRRRFDLKLRSIMSGGEALGETVLHWVSENLGLSVNEIFGQTEINYVVGGCAKLWPVKPGSMGRAYPGHRVAVVDEQGAVRPPGEVGEIAVHRHAPDGAPDPVFFLEYWRDPQATARKYAGDWCLTGDLATQDADGYFWYQGRADDVFKSAGYRIGPAEIENCLLRHAAVANAAVIGSPDETRGTVVKAFIVLAPDYQASPELEADIRAHVRGRLAPYEYPKEIEFIDELPMTTTGKVQRRVLRIREEEKQRQRSLDSPGADKRCRP